MWSGRGGSNPRPKAWEAFALPTELHPHVDDFIKFHRKLQNNIKKYFEFYIKRAIMFCEVREVWFKRGQNG